MVLHGIPEIEFTSMRAIRATRLNVVFRFPLQKKQKNKLVAISKIYLMNTAHNDSIFLYASTFETREKRTYREQIKTIDTG